MKHVPPPTGTPVDGPELSQDEIFSRLTLQERERAKTHRRIQKLRQQASGEIDRLIAFLDASDPYVQTELEDASEDEAAQCEGEGDACEDEGADVENVGEPSLGSVGANGDQELWAIGGRRDLEQEDDTGIADLDGLIEQSGGAA